MKILFIVQNIIGQGTFLRAFELAKALNSLGHELTIIATSKELRVKTSVSVIEGVEIIQASDFLPGPTRAGWDLVNLISRKRILNSRRFDIVHGFETRPTVIFPTLKMKKMGTPIFLDWADWFGKGGSVEERPNIIIKTLFRPIETFFENHYRQIAVGTTVICKALKERLEKFGIKENKICLLPNGLNIDDWQPIDITSAKASCGIDPGTYSIGYLGSLFQKDAALLAGSFNSLGKILPNAKLIHIGKSAYGVRQLIKDQDSLIETGPIGFRSMMTYLSACDVLWLPFRNIPANQGRFPFKFTNYLSSARPIISTDVGDIPDFIRKYNAGIVVKDNPENIVSSTNLLLNDKGLRESMALNARELSLNPEHSWRSRGKKLLSFYSELI